MGLSKDTETALYALSDALGLAIKQRGMAATCDYTRILNCGPLKLRADLRLRSDYIGQGCAACLLHIKGHLWAYAVSFYAGSGNTQLWLALFNGDSLDFVDFKMGGVKPTLEAIGNKIVAVYSYDNGWKLTEKEALLQGNA